jgi:GNAT superfamily N-acetyltransferase
MPEPEPTGPDTVRVRAATLSDAAAVAQLLTQLGAPGVDATEAVRRLERNYEEVLLGCVADAPAGLVAVKTILYFGHAKPVAHISALVVDERFRRYGVAKTLVQAAVAWAQARHCVGLELMCGLNPAREDAHRFYPAMGFQAIAYCYSMSFAADGA